MFGRKDIPICTIHKTYLATYCPHCVTENPTPCLSCSSLSARIKELEEQVRMRDEVATVMEKHIARMGKENKILEKVARGCLGTLFAETYLREIRTLDGKEPG
jgi:hypothetical protein